MKIKSTLPFFAIAGVIGSFKVVSEKGWLYLIPFWILLVVIAIGLDWLIRKWKL